MDIDAQFLKGSIGLLLLNLLSRGEMYGYEILQEASRRSANASSSRKALFTPRCINSKKKGRSSPSGGRPRTAGNVSITR